MSGTGRFITFEGGEGSGKSTQLAALHNRLGIAGGWSVTRAAEPGGTPLGLHIRQLVLTSATAVPPLAEALLFAADRAVNVATVIRPALARGDVVLCDRYMDSSIAYQGAGRGLGDDPAWLSTWATEALLPDLTVLLDIEPLRGLTRASQRGVVADRIEREGLDFHDRVRASFLDQAGRHPNRYLVLDAERSAETLADLIEARVRLLLNPTGPR